LLCISVCSATYNLKNSWTGANVINDFNYFTGPDPTHGYVYYASKSEAFSWNYVQAVGDKAYVRSDSSAVSSGSGRGSVRLSSPITFTKGLVLFDVVHMPFGAGTWPAFWTTQETNWPAGGEIDIIEGVNTNNYNTMTLHTSPGCTVPTNKDNETGIPGRGDCTGHQGCSITDYDTWSYGTLFNANQGGVWAMQWEDSGIYIWLWARGSVPSDVLNGTPNPAGWGIPRARFTFNQGCVGSSHFYNHKIIIDNTFCGDWAGTVYPGGMQACINFVQKNPGAFTEAYWLINYIKFYQQ
jgi:hypothetical protein